MSSITLQPALVADDVRMFRESVRHFVQSELVPRQPEWRERGYPGLETWTRAGEAGILLPDVPEEYGGGGGTFAHEAVLIEELALGGVNFGAILQSVVAHYILSYGNEEQKGTWIPRLASGELVGAIAMSEPGAGSDLQGMKTTARRDGDEYVVNGSKTFITNGFHAGLVILAVKTDTNVQGIRGISVLAVETADLPGYHAGQPLEKIGMHDQDTCELFFDDVRVPAVNLLGPAEGRGFFQMMERLSYERLAIAVSALATAERAIALTTKYVSQRAAFGKQLIDFQNTRFKLAECATEARVGRVFIEDCIQRFVSGQLDDTAAAMAKLWMTERECRIVDDCLQLHGGYGYMTEYPIAHMWTDSRVHRIYAGTNEILRELIATGL